MSSPLISIIMPVRNGSNYLAEALEGIKSQNVDMEIIVVDDGSSDNSMQIAERFGCIVLKHLNSQGPVISKNTALKIAKGIYVMFHDHDDVMNCGSLSKMLRYLQENKKVSAVMAQIRDFISPELSKEDKLKIVIRSDPYSGLFSGAILIKKDVFDVIGLFNESLKAGDIIDWNNKMREKGLQIEKLDFVSMNRRIHNSNFGRTNKEREFKDYAAILRSKINKEVKSQH